MMALRPSAPPLEEAMQRSKFVRSAISFAVLVCAAAPARAGEKFLVVSFDGLRFEGERPALVGSVKWERRAFQADYAPYVVLDGAGAVYLDYQGETNASPDAWVTELPELALRVDADSKVTGRLFTPNAALDGMTAHRFEVVAPRTDVDAKKRFFAAMEEHYSSLASRDLPGAAWFRHQRREARRSQGLALDDATAAPAFRARNFDDTLELFSGARALAENLDLERGLVTSADGEANLPVDSIEGVTTRALDWKTLVKGLTPELDPLAKLVPIDQHAIFFPTFAALTNVIDELDHAGTPLLEFAAADVEDARTKERYQEQLCLPLSAIARVLGPSIVSGVALTGGDPFVRAGTDVVVLFDCKEPSVLESYLALRRAEAAKRGAAVSTGDVGGARSECVRSPDRKVSSYAARFGNVVAVANSEVALRRVAETASGKTPALASADEYVWFRDRYRRGDSSESALIVLSDATIRRWAGPRARIADSRRVRAAAAMSEIQARHLPDLVGGRVADGASAADTEFRVSTDFVWSRDGVRSPAWGSLTFLTPLSEIAVDQVTANEKTAYDSFRTSFQRRWSNAFDPIAIRLSLDDAKLAADVTVMPLTAATDYRELREFAGTAALAPDAGDPHEGALAHFAVAFDTNSEIGRAFGGFLGGGLGADPLSWLGGGLGVYAERDAFWDELAKAPSLDQAMQEKFYRLPVVLYCDVRDPLKLAAFLTSVRGMVDQSVPNLIAWQTREFEGHGYVRIALDEGADFMEVPEDAALYYAALPKALIVSLREDVLQRALRRYDERKAGKLAPVSPWLGKSAALKVERDALDVITALGGPELSRRLTLAAWTPLPILDEWKRRFPDQDPVALHERFFGVRLVSPSGGAFEWNAETATMASSDYGSPAMPKLGPGLPRTLAEFARGAFGLDFEDAGLRARVEITRQR
jgi:hypothetical protein